LEKLQRSLGLRDEDIARFKQPLIQQAGLKHQQKLRQAAEQKQQEQEKAEYENKLRRYEQEFTKAVQTEYPLNQFIADGLKTFQQELGLKDEDVTRIEQQIREPVEAKYKEKLRQQEQSKQQQLKEAEERRKAEEQERQRLAQEKAKQQAERERLQREQRQAEEQERQSQAALLKQQERQQNDLRNRLTIEGSHLTIEALIFADKISVPARRFWRNLTGGDKSTKIVTEEEISWDDLPEDVKQLWIKGQNESEK